MFTHLLVPTDGSPASDRAVACAAGLARSLGAQITLFHAEADALAALAGAASVGAVGGSPELQARLDEAARQGLDHAEALVRAAGVACQRRISTGSAPWQLIVQVAGEVGADLIVMAQQHRGTIERLLAGSQTGQVLRHTRGALLVVH